MAEESLFDAVDPPDLVMDDIFDLVAAELDRQGALWGTQNHPSIPRPPFNAFKLLGIPSEVWAKSVIDQAVDHDKLTWGHIFVEELAEAIQAAVNDDVLQMEEELIQCVAVLVNWIFTNRRYNSVNERGE